MQENHRYKALSVLIDKAKQFGFILFDDIMDECGRFDLSIQDVDWVSNQIVTLNIIVRDEMPETESNDDDFFDFAQFDYDSVYRRIVEINPSLEDFIESVKIIIPPQPREFSKLKYQLFDGNIYARKRCIEMHLRIVLKIALRRYEQFGGELENYISDGIIGLIYSVDKYNPYKNGAFSSYASWWIINVIQRQQTTKNPLLYFPAHTKEDYFSVFEKEQMATDDFSNPYERNGIETLIYEKYQTGEISKELIAAFQTYESIESLMETDVEEKWVETNRLYSCEIDIYEEVEKHERRQRIETALSNLNEREREVIKMRNGFYENRVFSLEEIGMKFGVTRERIRQIEDKALQKLRHPSRRKYFEM